MHGKVKNGGRYVNNLGLQCHYGLVLEKPFSEDPVIGLWSTVLSREWDGTDGYMLTPQQQQQQGTRPDWYLIKWASDGTFHTIKAVIEAKPQNQEQQQDNMSDEQLRGYAVNALDEAADRGHPQRHVFGIKIVGTRIFMYDVQANERRLNAQDRRFNFEGEANFRGDGDFQDLVDDGNQVRGTLSCGASVKDDLTVYLDRVLGYWSIQRLVTSENRFPVAHSSTSCD